MLVCCHFGSVNRITPVFQVVFFRLENKKKKEKETKFWLPVDMDATASSR